MFFKYTLEDTGLNKKDKRMFSNKKYTCVNLYKDDKGRPVTIMKRKEASPMPYMSCIFIAMKMLRSVRRI